MPLAGGRSHAWPFAVATATQFRRFKRSRLTGIGAPSPPSGSGHSAATEEPAQPVTPPPTSPHKTVWRGETPFFSHPAIDASEASASRASHCFVVLPFCLLCFLVGFPHVVFPPRKLIHRPPVDSPSSQCRSFGSIKTRKPRHARAPPLYGPCGPAGPVFGVIFFCFVVEHRAPAHSRLNSDGNKLNMSPPTPCLGKRPQAHSRLKSKPHLGRFLLIEAMAQWPFSTRVPSAKRGAPDVRRRRVGSELWLALS